MEQKQNPYAAPSVVPVRKAESPRNTDLPSLGMPDLPLVFRQGAIDYLVIAPIAFLTGGAFLACLSGAIAASQDWSSGFIAIPMAIIALVAGAGFFGCLSAAVCSVKVDRESIRIQRILTKKILFKDIQSWHFHPVAKCVVISSFGQEGSYLLSNMVMSRYRSRLVGRVLEEFVGPAGGDGSSHVGDGLNS